MTPETFAGVPAVVIALTSQLKKLAKGQRPLLAPGVHQISQRVSFDLVGEMTVGEDHERTPTQSIPYKTAFALFVRYSGVTGEAAAKAMERALHEAIAMERDGEPDAKAKATLLKGVADLDDAEKIVQKQLDALPKKSVRGTVVCKKVKVTMSEITLLDEDGDEIAEMLAS